MISNFIKYFTSTLACISLIILSGCDLNEKEDSKNLAQTNSQQPIGKIKYLDVSGTEILSRLSNIGIAKEHYEYYYYGPEQTSSNDPKLMQHLVNIKEEPFNLHSTLRIGLFGDQLSTSKLTKITIIYDERDESIPIIKLINHEIIGLTTGDEKKIKEIIRKIIENNINSKKITKQNIYNQTHQEIINNYSINYGRMGESLLWLTIEKIN